MSKRRLGRTDLELPAVTLGAWAIGGWAWGGADDARSAAALRRGVELGLTAVDTAPVYGFGRSERVVGEALRGLGDRALVLTKGGLRWDDRRGEPFFRTEGERGPLDVFRNSRPDSLRLEVERSLARLGVERIDLYQIHWPDATTPIAESMGALADLRREGKLREIGVSNYAPEQLEEARRALGDVPLASVQPRYSLLAREIERDVLPAARRLEVGVLVYSPLAQGLLTGKVDAARTFPAGDLRSKKGELAPEARRRVNELLARVAAPIARAHGATLAQVALAWAFAQPGVTSAIAGVRTVEQAEENAGALGLELAPEELEALARAFPA